MKLLLNPGNKLLLTSGGASLLIGVARGRLKKFKRVITHVIPDDNHDEFVEDLLKDVNVDYVEEAEATVLPLSMIVDNFSQYVSIVDSTERNRSRHSAIANDRMTKRVLQSISKRVAKQKKLKAVQMERQKKIQMEDELAVEMLLLSL